MNAIAPINLFFLFAWPPNENCGNKIKAKTEATAATTTTIPQEEEEEEQTNAA